MPETGQWTTTPPLLPFFDRGDLILCRKRTDGLNTRSSISRVGNVRGWLVENIAQLRSIPPGSELQPVREKERKFIETLGIIEQIVFPLNTIERMSKFSSFIFSLVSSSG